MKLAEYISFANKVKKENQYEKKINICILRSFTCEMLESMLITNCYNDGYVTNIHLGKYNQFFSEALNASSDIYATNPDIFMLAIRIEDFYPVIFDEYYTELPAMEDHIENICSQIYSVIESINKHSKTTILLNSFTRPYFEPSGIYLEQSSFSVENIINRINIRLNSILSVFNNVYFVGVENIIRELGLSNSYDLKMWNIAKNPYSFKFYELLALKYSQYVSSLYGKRKKCIVLDLDNTLWKGVAAETGYNNIVMHREFQRQLKFLNQSGILLAISSKNNEADVMPVLKDHPDMILKHGDFVCFKINWNNKADNIKLISEELNIGLDSIIFIDDNAMECDLVKTFLPEVDVYCLPDNELLYPDVVKNLKYVDALALTDEDLNKTSLYLSQSSRKELKDNSVDLISYLRNLKMEIFIESITDFNISRVTQLVQKTNQFNMTAKRFTQEEIHDLIQCGYIIYVLSLKDKFGSNGVTGVIIIKQDSNDWLIENFILSCRIMGRNVEYAFMAYIFQEAMKNNIKDIKGIYVPTSKNAPVKDLYKNMGFDGVSDIWQKSVNDTFELPDYIKIER